MVHAVTNRAPRFSSANGLTLVEVLVALCVAAILMSILARTLNQAMLGSEILASTRQDFERLSTLQRMLHRDIQGIDASSSLVFETNSFSFITSNTLLMPAPFPVRVTWNFKDNSLVRLEQREEISYERKSTLIDSLGDFQVFIYRASSGEWEQLNVVALASAKEDIVPGMYSALRLVLSPDSSSPAIFLERFPYASLKK